MPGIAYLGPEGTFTEAALRALAAAGMIPPADSGTEALTPVATDSTPAALEAVRAGAVQFACVPIENSIDGPVLPTLDSLAEGEPLQIYAELTLDVSFTIAVRPGVAAADVRTVAAFPVAAAQVKKWLSANLPNAELVPSNSNAAAAQAIMPPIATDQGTERSIWPSRMTSIMPVAMTPRNEATLSCCSRYSGDRKPVS